MDAKELRIGNYVNYGHGECIVESHDFETFKNSRVALNGIPLTEEWLLKMGFERSKQPNGHIFYGNRAFGMRIIGHPYNDGYILFGYEGSVDIPYVHILQNLYRCLTGTELEIKEQ